MNPATILIIGYGNPGRGDDGLGPALVERIEDSNYLHVTCQSDMQLQVEYVTDLEGYDAIIFVDADASCKAPFEFAVIEAEKDDSYTSHAMTPQALLHAFRHVFRHDAPAAFLLRIRGQQFELGAPLSTDAQNNLDAGTAFAKQLCAKAASTDSVDHIRQFTGCNPE